MPRDRSVPPPHSGSLVSHAAGGVIDVDQIDRFGGYVGEMVHGRLGTCSGKRSPSAIAVTLSPSRRIVHRHVGGGGAENGNDDAIAISGGLVAALPVPARRNSTTATATTSMPATTAPA